MAQNVFTRPARAQLPSDSWRPEASRPPGHQSERRTVVVGYDGSRAARRALLRAAQVAGGGGRVVVVTAVPPADVLGDEPEIGSTIAEPESLSAEATALLAAHDVQVATHVEEAEPAEALVAAAAETGAALVVVGARGDSYLVRALRGSVAEKLVARSPCDLLVVR
jgi:nucleotide-binding universal stress UspA family protein